MKSNRDLKGGAHVRSIRPFQVKKADIALR